VVLTNLTLDGVTQAPGRLNEDRRGGLQPGGWATPRADPVIGSAAAESMATAGALLLGSTEGERLACDLPASPTHHPNPTKEVPWPPPRPSTPRSSARPSGRWGR
jgi:hypothetical protein